MAYRYKPTTGIPEVDKAIGSVIAVGNRNSIWPSGARKVVRKEHQV